VRDPLKGWTREDAARTDTFSLKDSAVAGTGLGLQVVEVAQPGLAAKVGTKIPGKPKTPTSCDLPTNARQ
jgi:hypothetical protein